MEAASQSKKTHSSFRNAQRGCLFNGERGNNQPEDNNTGSPAGQSKRGHCPRKGRDAQIKTKAPAGHSPAGEKSETSGAGRKTASEKGKKLWGLALQVQTRQKTTPMQGVADRSALN